MRHFYSEIQGWFSFKPVYEEAVAKAPKDQKSVFVEIGCWKGKSTSFMGVEIANSGKPIKFYAVDHFLGSDEKVHHEDQDVMAGTLFRTFKHNISPVKDYVNVLKMPSDEAAKLFDDGSVDFVLLDGGHSYEDVRTDLDEWLPKMRDNGVIAGDDWNWSGVKDAVTETFDASIIEVLGNDKGRHWRVKL